MSAQDARRALLARMLITQIRVAVTIGDEDSEPRARAAALRTIAGDLQAVHVTLAAELLPGPPRRLRSISDAEAALADAGVRDDGFLMPRCRATADMATRAALAEDAGRPLGPIAMMSALEAAIAHAATARDLAEALGHQEGHRLAEDHHGRLVLALDRLRPRKAGHAPEPPRRVRPQKEPRAA